MTSEPAVTLCQHNMSRTRTHRSLQFCLITLLVCVFGLQAGVTGTLDLQAPKSVAQPVTVNEDEEPGDTDAAPDDDQDNGQQEAPPENVENDTEEPTGVRPGFAAGDSFAPQYQSNGFNPINPEGKPVFGPSYHHGQVPPAEETEADAENTDSTEGEPSDDEAAQAPGPVERPLPPDPGSQYDTLLLQKQAGVPASRQ